MAEDLVQVALTRLHKRWQRIDPEGVDAYACKVIANLAIDDSRRPHRRYEVADIVPDAAGPADSGTETRLDVRRALRCLAPRQRAVLVLRFYSDLTVTETAKALRITPGTVKSQSARGLRTLQELLSQPYLATMNETVEVAVDGH